VKAGEGGRGGGWNVETGKPGFRGGEQLLLTRECSPAQSEKGRQILKTLTRKRGGKLAKRQKKGKGHIIQGTPLKAKAG